MRVIGNIVSISTPGTVGLTADDEISISSHERYIETLSKQIQDRVGDTVSDVQYREYCEGRIKLARYKIWRLEIDALHRASKTPWLNERTAKLLHRWFDTFLSLDPQKLPAQIQDHYPYWRGVFDKLEYRASSYGEFSIFGELGDRVVRLAHWVEDDERPLPTTLIRAILASRARVVRVSHTAFERASLTVAISGPIAAIVMALTQIIVLATGHAALFGDPSGVSTVVACVSTWITLWVLSDLGIRWYRRRLTKYLRWRHPAIARYMLPKRKFQI